jgi:sugar lactone lactonase YvrE
MLFVVSSRWFLAVSLFTCGALSGCECNDGSDTDDGVGGEGGEAPTCEEGGSGTLEIVVSGLPAGVSADVEVTGPSGERSATGSETISDAATGDYDVTAGIVTSPDPIVRTAYEPTVDTEQLCLADGSSERVTITYAPIPSSNKLWTTNGSGGNGAVLGFASSVLGSTGDPTATVAATGGAGHDVTFDKDGNMWAMGATLGDPTLLRYPAASLGSSGPKEADIEIVVTGSGCIPAATGMAFDPQGNLWVTSPCDQEVYRLSAADLTSSGERTASVTIGGLDSPRGIAFDNEGAMWVADPIREYVARYDASRLGASSNDAPDKTVTSETPTMGAFFGPAWIAFDENGDLWSNDFGANAVFRIPSADLAGTGDATITPPVSITIGVTGLLESMAFDESGGLWMAGSQGRLIRLAQDQLDESSGPGAPTTPATVITSADIGYAQNFALYPASAALPLFHALP